ncbi:MAG: hypothetical protein WKF96_03720 [Solirubrobacteraceae bacterium]
MAGFSGGWRAAKTSGIARAAQAAFTAWTIPWRARSVRTVFTAEDREALRDQLVAAAQADRHISAAALVGSSALGREDRWSDIDLALCLASAGDRTQTIADWTDRMYQDHAAVHHLDVHRGEVVYRVFLLSSTLQVDVSFWPPGQFGAVGPNFRLLFGAAGDPVDESLPAPIELIGMGWLYALHARSSIARGRMWQAEYMISGVRDQVLALACLRHGVPAVHGRGMDSLPPGATAAVAPAIVRSLDVPELERAFAASTEALLVETERADPELADRLAAPLRELAG